MSLLLKILSSLLMKSYIKTVIIIDVSLHASLDVDALFANIPLDGTIDICVKKLFKTPETLVEEISKNDFRDLLNLANHFLHLTASFIFK